MSPARPDRRKAHRKLVATLAVFALFAAAPVSAAAVAEIQTPAALSGAAGAAPAAATVPAADAADPVVTPAAFIARPQGGALVRVKVGGVRQDDASVDRLNGVTLKLYATETATTPVAGAWATCVSQNDTTEDGICAFPIPSNQMNQRFWVRQSASVDNWFHISPLVTGAANSPEATTYQFRTPTLVANTTYTSGATNFMGDTDPNYGDVINPSYTRSASGGVWQQSVANPTIPDQCGLDLALVLDLSSSVGSQGLSSLKTAANTFITALTGTPTRLAIYTFASNAPAASTNNGNNDNLALTSLSTTESADIAKAKVNGLTLPGGNEGGTNWDRGLFQVAQSPDVYDVALVITDGAPTFRGPDDVSDLGLPAGPGTFSRFHEVEDSVFSANAIKAAATRIIAIGVGAALTGPPPNNLQAVSGPTENSDYYLVDNYDQLGINLKDLALKGCAGTVTVVKKVIPVGGTVGVAAAGWRIDPVPGANVSAVTPSPGFTDAANGAANFALSFTGTAASGTVTFTEESRLGYSLVQQATKNAVCTNTSTGAAVTVTNVGGLGFSLTAQKAAPIACTVVNRALPTVTLRKAWVNGAQGDTAVLTISGGTGGVPSNTSTASGATGTQTDTTNVATRVVSSGTQVTVTEALGAANKGGYTSALSCPGVTPNSSGVFTMPNANVVCTFTNTRTSANLTLQKAWVNSVTGDTAVLSIDGSTDGSATSTAPAAPQTNNRVRVPVFSGETVALAEVLGAGNTGSYTAGLTCSPAGGLVYTTGALTGSFTMPKTAAATTCEFRNTRTSNTLTLRKAWVNGAQGDTAVLTITGGSGGVPSNTSTASGATGTQTDTTNVATRTVLSGAQVSVAEVLGGAGSYTSALSCTGGATPNASGVFTMPNAAVTCTFTNTRTANTLTLRKAWVNGAQGDTAVLTITGGSGGVPSNTSTASGATGTQTDTTNVATRTVLSGAQVSVAEVLGGANKGGYTSALSCPGATPNAAGGFTMPNAPVTCTFTNTRTSANLTLQKVWVNSLSGDTAVLSIDGSTDGSATSTAPAAPQTSNRVTVAVFSGETVALAEVLGAGNTGSYSTGLTCSPSGGLVYTTGALTGSFTMPKTAAATTCEFRNTLRTASLSVTKSVVNPDGFSPLPPFTVDVACRRGAVTLTFPDLPVVPGTPAVVAAVPIGFECTVTEDPLTNPPNWTWSAPSYNPANAAGTAGVRTVTTAGPNTVAVTNTIRHNTAELLLVKTVEGGESTPVEWTLTATSGGAPTYSADGAATTPQTVWSGVEYRLEEAGPSGYLAGQWTCSDAQGAPVAVSQGSFVTVPSGASVTCRITNSATVPGLDLTKTTTTGAFVEVGDPIVYTYTATNNGNVQLTDVQITDDVLGGVLGVDGGSCTIDGLPVAVPAEAILPSGKSLVCTWTYNATAADVAADRVTNIATAAGTAPDDSTVPSNQATVTVGRAEITLVKVTVPDPSSFAGVGDVVSYSLVATNTGVVPLAGVLISDPRLGALSCVPAQPADLAPGGSLACTGSYAVVAGDVAAERVDNTATASGRTPDGAVVSDQDDASVLMSAISLDKRADPSSGLAVGGTVTYTFTATNTGGTTLTGVTIADVSLPGLQLGAACAVAETLPPGGAKSCTGTYVVTQADVDTGLVANTATASGTGPGGVLVADSDPETVTTAQSASVSIVKSVSPESVPAGGGPVTYTFVVRNTGTVTLSDVSVSDRTVPGLGLVLTCRAGDPGAGAVLPLPVASLAPGASVTCTAPYTVTAADLGDDGVFTNVAAAAGTPPAAPGGPTPPQVTSPPDDATVSEAEITLVKTADVTLVDTVGDIITYTFTATNTGEVTLTDVTISDTGLPGLSALTCAPVAQPATLDPGDELRCTATYAVTQADLDSRLIANTATATGTTPDGEDVTDADDEEVPAVPLATFTVVKTVPPFPNLPNLDIPDFPFDSSLDGRFSLHGREGTRQWTGLVAPQTVRVEELVDSPSMPPFWVLGSVECLDAAGNEVDHGNASARATVALRPGDNVTCTFFNTLDADPGITLVKSAAPATVLLGGTVTYTMELTNSGNVPLQLRNPLDADFSTVIDDPMCSPITLDEDASAAFDQDGNLTTLLPAFGNRPAETWVFRCVKTGITADMIDPATGEVTNTARAGLPNPLSIDPDDPANDLTAEDDAVVGVLIPQIALTKEVDKPIVSAGTEVTYTYRATNPGGVPLAGVALTDDTCSPVTPDQDLGDTNGDGLLDPGEEWVYTCTMAITVTTTNVATLTGTPTLPDGQTAPPLTVTDDAVVQVESGGIGIDKSASSTTVAAGAKVTFSYAVTNTGDVPLSNVRVDDDKCSPVEYLTGDADGDRLLDVDERWLYTCTSTITQSTTNVATGSGQTPGGTTVTATDTVTVSVTPGASTPATGMPSWTGALLACGLALLATGALLMAGRRRGAL